MKTALTPIAGAILLSLTSVTIAQADEKPNPVETTAPLTLPAEGVSITDTNGRTITAAVTSSDAKGITIRMADGKEHHIAWNKLNAKTSEKILGKAAPQSPPRSTPEQIIADKFKTIEEIRERAKAEKSAVGHLSPAELTKMFVEKDERVSAATASLEHGWNNFSRHFVRRDPEWKNNNFHFLHIAPDMEIKPAGEEEEVSLRPRFEQLGIRAREQEKNMCWIYSAYHLAQYAFLADGKTPPTVNELKTKLRAGGKDPNASGGGDPQSLIAPLNEISGERLKVLWLGMAPFYGKNLGRETIKHQLRNGRACIVQTWETIGTTGGLHWVVITGFHTKNGKTTWEIMNSNNVAKDNGFEQMPILRNDAANGISFWFE